jgi:hypothetical protein
MANVTTSTGPNGDTLAPTFRAIQLLPAPMTLVALTIAAGHQLGSAPLGVIAVVGALATIASAVIPSVRPRIER